MTASNFLKKSIININGNSNSSNNQDVFKNKTESIEWYRDKSNERSSLLASPPLQSRDKTYLPNIEIRQLSDRQSSSESIS